MRYNFLRFFFLFSISTFCQEKNKVDNVSIESLHKVLDTLEKSPNVKVFINTLDLIKKRKTFYCIDEGESCTNYKELYAKAIKLKMIAHFRKDQRDSVIYYYPYVKENTSDPNLIGYAALMAANAKQNNLDYSGFLALKDESIAYYKKANNHLLNFGNYYDLIFFYLDYGSINNAAQSLRYLELELESLENNAAFNEFDKVYKLVKANYLKSKGNYDESIAILGEIDINNLKRGYEKWEYYNILFNNYLKKNTPKEALEYYNKVYNNTIEKFNILDFNYQKNFNGALLFEALNDEDKYERAINGLVNFDIKKDPYKYKVNNILSRYYANKKEYKKAFKYLVTYNRIEDSLKIVNENILKEITTYNLRKNKEVKALTLNNEKNKAIIEKDKKILISVTVILLLIGSFIVGVVYFYKNRKNYKTKLELSKTKEILNYKNNFLENVSHEMRTPITIVLGYLSLIQNKILDSKKVLQYSNIAINNSEQLIGTLNNFLKVSQIENKEDRQIVISSKKMNVFFNTIVNSFTVSAELKNIRLFYKSNINENTSIEYQYEDLKKIIENLISNALKYSNSNTSIYISCTINDKNLILSVKDEGIGINKEDQKNVFNKFYQSKAHAVTGGFGIGLSLVNGLVKDLKGNIELSSKPNVGSLFIISLPHHLNNYSLHIKSKNEDFSLLTTDANLDEITNNLPKALIVDDNIEMISYYKELLSNSLHCFFTFNGNEALEIIKNEAIDIIISDYRMPIMDGIEFKKALNKDNNLKDIPFIMVSAVSYDFVNDPKMKLGLNDYIAKPFDKNELTTRIRALLENKMYAKQLLSDNNTEEIVFKNEYSELLDKVNTIIRKNLNNSEFDVKTLASECGYTQRNLNNILQKATGLTLVKTVLEIRLQKAYEFIINNAYSSLSEIMFETGFNSRPYFYKKFKNRFGIKPGELKKKYS